MKLNQDGACQARIPLVRNTHRREQTRRCNPKSRGETDSCRLRQTSEHRSLKHSDHSSQLILTPPLKPCLQLSVVPLSGPLALSAPQASTRVVRAPCRKRPVSRTRTDSRKAPGRIPNSTYVPTQLLYTVTKTASKTTPRTLRIPVSQSLPIHQASTFRILSLQPKPIDSRKNPSS